jgi:hypothetical protein
MDNHDLRTDAPSLLGNTGYLMRLKVRELDAGEETDPRLRA